MRTVLIADDSEFMRNLIRRMLERNNYQVVGQASDGKEAVKMYAQLLPDFVTMDVMMPGLNGLNAVKEILKFDKNAYIFMVSSMGQEEYIDEAIKIGAKGFINKPFTEADLVRSLQK